MDTQNGRIYTEDELAAMEANQLQRMQAFLAAVTPTPKQMTRTPPAVWAYDPCPCGSGKKFRWCCKGKKV